LVQVTPALALKEIRLVPFGPQPRQHLLVPGELSGWESGSELGAVRLIRPGLLEVHGRG
jgi:hypothetical protein